MPDLLPLLRSTFGHPAFRANQEAVCQAATDGRDVLLVMPTGAGKSLCYQLPALARGGTALVVSPLIALMDDQAHKLTAAGLRVARIHSGLSRDDSRQACRDYLNGTLQFLFIAPERMRVPGFPEMLARRKPSLVAIDEAHCISAWGHDFRPDYRTLGDFLPALRPAPVIALTATATPTVQRDIATQLHLQQPSLFIHGFRRENLAIEVLELSKPQRTEFAVDFLRDPARRPAIVYAPSRKAAEELAGELTRALGKKTSPGLASGTRVHAYHAGLDPGTRERVQREFLAGSIEVVVATIAFGMGIDKANVRTVLHIALPASVEAFYQEIGRAGRDGLPSRTVLLWSYADRKTHEFFLERDYPILTDLNRVAASLTENFESPGNLMPRLKMAPDTFARAVEKLAAQGVAQLDVAGNLRRAAAAGSNWQAGYTQQVDFRRSQIDRMMAFAQGQQCRMSALIRHFGDTSDAHRPCGHCDFCAPASAMAQTLAEPSAGQDSHLRAILRALDGQSRATGKLFTDLALTKDRKIFDSYLDGLARAGLIALSSENFTNPEGSVIPYRKASLTHEGRELAPGARLGVLLSASSGASSTKKSVQKLIANGTTAQSTPDEEAKLLKREAQKKRIASREELAATFTAEQQLLSNRLKEWRKEEAASNGRPAFFVLTDALLLEVVFARPQSLSQLGAVKGMGQAKVDLYGAAIIALCRDASAPARFGDIAGKLRHPRPQSEVSTADDGYPAEPDRQQAPTAFRREHSHGATSADTLTSSQQTLEDSLRAWRKSESERMGLPQFFVLGTSALRSIVLARPRTLAELARIAGVGPDKLDRFGAAILALTNA